MVEPRDLLRTVLDVGIRRSGYRMLWELETRLGVRELLQPASVVPVPFDVPPSHVWLEELGADHFLVQVRHVAEEGCAPVPMDVVRRAEDARHGRVLLFGARDVELGSPRDFSLEPLTGRRWSLAHWSRVLSEDVGDPRVTWEANRDLCVWDWVRAWSIDHDPRWPAAFAAHLRAFEAANPFRRGINWANGQELALRVIGWVVAAATFVGRAGFEEDDYRRFVRLSTWHGHQLHVERNFARYAVPNNHLLAESLAAALLAEVGIGRRSEDSLEVFRSAVGEQFGEDGGYCQHSHRYHRYALELLLLADRLFPSLRETCGGVFRRALPYFESMLFDEKRVPNYGPNDGAAAFRLAECSSADVRPLLASLRHRVEGWGAPEEGPWDEQVFWLYGERPRLGPPWRRSSCSFRSAGLHVMHHEGWSVSLRCGSLPRRGGHADQLHVDVWREGEPRAVDAGSLSYRSDRHPWFVGTGSHNTVTVDGRDQLELVAPFTWAGECAGQLVEFDADGVMVATCDAWRSHDLVHEREVRVTSRAVCIRDRLSPTAPRLASHDFRLHWLLPVLVEDVEVTGGECFTWNISTPAGTIEIEARPIAGSLFEVAVVKESASTSPIYTVEEGATSIVAIATGASVRFDTTFRVR